VTTLLARVVTGWRTGKAKDHARDDALVLAVIREQGLAGLVDVMKALNWGSYRTVMTLARLEASRRVRADWVPAPQVPVDPKLGLNGRRRMYWVEEES
jgi:hypothetical protein